jgi:pimeloyl-ACP methyl ester carboxylesterase
MQSDVRVEIGTGTLEASLDVPPHGSAVVMFAHGSGSSRHSPRNRRVAEALRRAGLGTLLIDLLTPAEEIEDAATAHLRFDIPLLAGRLVSATDWLVAHLPSQALSVGYFGASTGAAAALVAATLRPDIVRAVVSRGGRPDLAHDVLHQVRTPTLLIVGGDDQPVIRLNQEALKALPGEKDLKIIAGASHLFGEPGALEQVATLAAAWFARYLVAAATARSITPSA